MKETIRDFLKEEGTIYDKTKRMGKTHEVGEARDREPMLGRAFCIKTQVTEEY